MQSFTKKNLQGAERVCFRLASLRESRGVTVEVLAQQTKINKHYLQALEECRFSDIPFSTLYQKNFVKKYVSALGEDPEPYLSQFYIEEMDAADNKPVATPQQRPWHFFTAWSSVVRNSVLAFGGLLMVTYLGLQVKQTIAPPQLALVGLDNGFIVQDKTVTLRGFSEPEAQVLVNGQTIKSDEQGNFAEAIALNPGVNTIVVEAKKKHGKTTQTTRHVIYKEPTHFSAQDTVLGVTN